MGPHTLYRKLGVVGSTWPYRFILLIKEAFCSGSVLTIEHGLRFKVRLVHTYVGGCFSEQVSFMFRCERPKGTFLENSIHDEDFQKLCSQHLSVFTWSDLCNARGSQTHVGFLHESDFFHTCSIQYLPVHATVGLPEPAMTFCLCLELLALQLQVCVDLTKWPHVVIYNL